MTHEVRLTAGAERDLATLHDYIATHRSPAEADALLDVLIERVVALEMLPMRGSVPEELATLGITEFRQVLLPPYRIIYRVYATTVFIMLIADGRRDMQALLERRLLG